MITKRPKGRPKKENKIVFRSVSLKLPRVYVEKLHSIEARGDGMRVRLLIDHYFRTHERENHQWQEFYKVFTGSENLTEVKKFQRLLGYSDADVLELLAKEWKKRK